MTSLTEEEEKADESIRHTIGSNIKASLLANIFYLATRLCIPPIVLAYVSLAEYGLWSYCFIILSYLGMGVFGITNVYVRYIAVYCAKKKYNRINELLSTGIISISAICLALFALLWFGLPFLLGAFHIDEQLQETAFFLILGSTLIFMADLSIGAFTYVLQSLQLFVAEKIIWILSFTMESLLIIIFLMQGYGIYALLWAFAIRTAISLILSAYIAKQRLPFLSVRMRFFKKNMLGLFLGFGGIVQLSGLLGIINRSVKKVLAGLFIGLEATGLYEVGEKFPTMSLNLPGSITAVLLPAAAQFHANQQEEKIIQIYTQGSRLINLLTGSMMGFMAAFSTPLIKAWLGLNPIYEVAASILTWFTFAYQMDTLTGPLSAIYRAINYPQRELFYGTLQLSSSLLAAGIGFYFYGPSIAVINISIATMMALSALAYLHRGNNFLGIKHLHFFKSVIIPGMYPYAFGFVLWWLMHPFFDITSRMDILWLFLAAGAIYLLTWMPVLYWGVCSASERKQLNAYILKRGTPTKS